MSSDMKKRTLRGRLRDWVAGALALADWLDGWAAAGSAVAIAAPAALARKFRREVVGVNWLSSGRLMGTLPLGK
jgi:hypothetical protein